MKKYPKYKDSGVSWIGEIPEHWKLGHLRNYLKLVSDKGHPNELLLSVTRDRGVIIRNVDSKEENHNFIPDDLSGYKLVKVGQFAINKMKSWQGSYAVSEYQGIVSPAYYICDLNFPYKKFFSIAIRSRAYIPFFTQYSKGIRVDQWDLSPIALKSIPFIEPPLPEQRAIVSFLDAKTAQVDCFIAEAEKEIEKLNELKQAQIAHLVTHGLNPDVPMKNSEIAWIGQIPAHWEVRKIRSHFKERRTKVSDKDYPALSVAREGIVPQLETAVKTDNGDNRKLVLKNDFVVNSRSDRKGSCGVSDYDGSVSLISIVLEPRDIYSKYAHHLFRSNNYIEEFYRNGRGIVADLWTTRYSEMKNIFMPIPPNKEQVSIVSAINSMSEKIDTLTTKLNAQIGYLKELKQRIISDAVTGKVRVR